ncbi:acyl-CoA dehydrogenase family protein [Leucobacter rhizosphaerae]|uniref:Acyl-CoA dehydrogenase family protein n=1 Tax=Leucobacter rhizosphaerae TaxID=2932245 RepID=A0ABY4FS33_9MICO|nr:acyl-CoA dehydrogenase family protein [Leucobacter rhizosphaerae]UOQ59062.1 acyl-CoA dehydrogenase family protein [Leucobacter rhizosphaerae]
MTSPAREPAITAGSAIGIDPLGYAESHLSEPARAALARLQRVLRAEIHPLLAEAWESASMPPAVLDALVPLDPMRPDGVSVEEAESSLYSGFRNYVLARTDVSVATLVNAQTGLFRTTVRLGGSPEQVAELDPRILSFDLTGVFALTEPEHGSDIAGGLSTSARRDGDGDDWILDGAKHWIGGAVSADVLAVFARDAADAQVKVFLVPRDAPGVTLETITGKVSLRPMQNATIRLDGVRVPERARLQRVNAWPDVARILGAMRSDVAWIATGLQAGALDAALAYVREREQFGRPVAGFQLVQEKLARMLGNLTASLGLVTQLSARQDAGVRTDENSSLAKMWTALHARETVALGREIVGGNGLLLEHDVARFFADAEAVYSYEGTHEITSLIVGRALTGVSAFT